MSDLLLTSVVQVGILFVMLVGYWMAVRRFGQPKVLAAINRLEVFSDVAWKAMLYVEQTIKGDPEITDEELKEAAIDYATLLLRRIGLRNISDEDVKALEGLIEATVREFKLMVGPPSFPKEGPPGEA